MQIIIGIILGILIQMAAFIGFGAGVKMTGKEAAKRAVKYKAEIKMVLGETHSLDTEADKEHVWKLIDEIKY